MFRSLCLTRPPLGYLFTTRPGITSVCTISAHRTIRPAQFTWVSFSFQSRIKVELSLIASCCYSRCSLFLEAFLLLVVRPGAPSSDAVPDTCHVAVRVARDSSSHIPWLSQSLVNTWGSLLDLGCLRVYCWAGLKIRTIPDSLNCLSMFSARARSSTASSRIS